MGEMRRGYRLLLLAHTVQNFSLKPPSSVDWVDAGALGCCWPFVCEVSAFPSRPMVVVSGTSSGGGGGGGGCARRLGSVDMITEWISNRKECMVFCYRRRVLHVKMEAAALRLLKLELELHTSISLHKPWRMDPHNHFKTVRSRELPEDSISIHGKCDLNGCHTKAFTSFIDAKGVSMGQVNIARVLLRQLNFIRTGVIESDFDHVDPETREARPLIS
jgi:hypothetical protein